MKFRLRWFAVLLVCWGLVSFSFGSAYNARPKLIVVIVIDQFRGDYLERYRDQFGEGGLVYSSITAPTSATAITTTPIRAPPRDMPPCHTARTAAGLASKHR